MSKRTLRRAAERQAHKADRKLTAHAGVSAAPVPFIPEPEDFDEEDLTPTPDIEILIEPVDTTPTTAAQIQANRENSKLSTGPVTLIGKATVSQNHRTHGLTGHFTVLPWENPADFQALVQSVYTEHNPDTDTEQRLADSVIQHYWLKERALQLQEKLLAQSADPTEVDAKKLALFLRYQTTHERSYYKAEKELRNIKKERRKEQIGFESQKRIQESHEARTRLAHARALNLEIDAACGKVIEVPLPGNETISFEELAQTCGQAITRLIHYKQMKAAA